MINEKVDTLRVFVSLLALTDATKGLESIFVWQCSKWFQTGVSFGNFHYAFIKCGFNDADSAAAAHRNRIHL